MPPRKPAEKISNGPSRISRARLAAMIEEATVDAYGDSEQKTGWYTMLDEHLALPFVTTVLGVVVQVARLDLRGEDEIVAICTRGREQLAVPILDLPLPRPKPAGAEWIEAYRLWVKGSRRGPGGARVPWRPGVAPGNRPADFFVTATVTMPQSQPVESSGRQTGELSQHNPGKESADRLTT